MNKQTESLVDRIDLLLKQRNEKRAFLAEVIGITAMSFSDWKRRGTIPAGDICVKIANYFNVSVEWLITGEEPKADSGPKPSNEDNEITKLFNDLQSLPSPQKQVITAIIQSSISQIKSSLA